MNSNYYCEKCGEDRDKENLRENQRVYGVLMIICTECEECIDTIYYPTD